MIGRDQTARLMRAAGIEGARRSKRAKTTRPDPTSTRHPDLVKREFTAEAPNRLWPSGPGAGAEPVDPGESDHVVTDSELDPASRADVTRPDVPARAAA